jgi:hypothetical protein
MARFTGERFVRTVSDTCAPSTTAYTAKDQFGTKLTFKNAVPNDIGGGVIKSAKLVDTSMMQKRTKLLLFNQDLAVTSATGDNAALNIADADLSKLIGVVDFSTGTFTAIKDNAVAVVSNLNIGFDLPTDNKIYGVLETFGTGTYGSGETITVFLDITEM